MNALLRALTDSRGIENIEQALGMPDITSDAMRRAIDGWFDAWFSRVPPDEEDPCQRIPYAVVNKLGKAVFAEYDSSLQNTGTPKLQYLDRARQAFDAKKRELLQWCMVGGETWAKPVFAPDGLTWQVIRRDAVLILGRAPDGRVTDLACCEKSVVADRQYYTLVERRTTGPDGRLTIENRLYQADNKATLGRRVPLQSLAQYERLADAYTYPAPLDGLGLVALKMPTVNCVDGSPDGVAVYEPAMGLIHNINRNEYQLAREFELGRMRIAASADLLTAENGRKRLRDDLFVGLEGSEQTVGITAFAPALRNENYEARRQAYLKAVENLLAVATLRMHARAAGIHEMVVLGPKVRVVSAQPLPESRQMRLKRVYPGSTHAQPKGMDTWLTLVPRPKTMPVGGKELVDRPMLEWAEKFINSIYAEKPQALEE